MNFFYISNYSYNHYNLEIFLTGSAIVYTYLKLLLVYTDSNAHGQMKISYECNTLNLF